MPLSIDPRIMAATAERSRSEFPGGYAAGAARRQNWDISGPATVAAQGIASKAAQRSAAMTGAYNAAGKGVEALGTQGAYLAKMAGDLGAQEIASSAQERINEKNNEQRKWESNQRKQAGFRAAGMSLLSGIPQFFAPKMNLPGSSTRSEGLGGNYSNYLSDAQPAETYWNQPMSDSVTNLWGSA
jgi:hypothetical protein